MKTYIKIFIILIIASEVSFGQWTQKEFVIGSFMNPELTLDTLKDLSSLKIFRSAFFNMLTFPNEKNHKYLTSNNGIIYTLYLCSRLNLYSIAVDMKSWIPFPWNKNVREFKYNFNSASNDVARFYSKLSDKLKRYLYGFYIKDEPAPPSIEPLHLKITREWIRFYNQLIPTKIAVVNMLPIYAISKYYKGFSSKNDYENYLDAYLNPRNSEEKPKVVAFDNYLGYQNSKNVNYFYNLSLIKKKAGDRPFWGHVDVVNRVSKLERDSCDISYLRFSVYSLLCYGAKGIIYFPYEEKNDTNSALVVNGKPTYKYTWAFHLNRIINKIVGPIIINSKWVGVYHKDNFLDKNGNILEIIPNDEKITASTGKLKDISNRSIMIGEYFNNKDNKYYLIVTNKGFHNYFPAINTEVDIDSKNLSDITIYKMNNNSVIKNKINYRIAGDVAKFDVKSILPGEGKIIELSYSK